MSEINDKLREEFRKRAEQSSQQGQEQEQSQQNHEQQAAAAAEQQQQQNNQQPTLDDKSVLQYLSEKRGVTLDSLDALKSINDNPFASEEVETFNKFVKETNGRGLNDYLELQRDYSEASDVDIARKHYLLQNPNMTNEDFDLLHDVDMTNDLQPLEGDDYSPQEIEARNQAIKQRERDIKRRDAILKQKANEARQYFDAQKEKYKAPKENAQQLQVQQGQEAWKENITNAVKDFNLGIEGYEHNVSADDLTNRYSSIENILGLFKNESGAVDYRKLVTTLERGLAQDNILKVREEMAANKAKEQVLAELENPGATLKNQELNNLSPEMQAMRAKFQSYINSQK